MSCSQCGEGCACRANEDNEALLAEIATYKQLSENHRRLSDYIVCQPGVLGTNLGTTDATIGYIEHLRAENKAAWDSAEYNADRAREAEAEVEKWKNICEKNEPAMFKAAQADDEECARLRTEVEALRDLAQWMTGAPYDFMQHQYFVERTHLLASGGTEEVELVSGV